MSKIISLPLIQDIWSFFREKRIFRKHKEVSDFWSSIIDEYFSSSLPKYEVLKKKNLTGRKIIWQYWGQGIDDNLPEGVELCFSSIDKYKDEWIIIRLDDSTISEYLEFPQFVYEKINNDIFNKTFFSDLLRLALLKNYGGVWFDATIFLTGTIPNELAALDYFMYQRDFNEDHKSFWKKSYAFYWNWNDNFKVNVLNSIFFSQKNGYMVSVLLDLMLHYWATQVEVKDYFFFQILYDDLVKDPLIEERCKVISDVAPHVLQTLFNGGVLFLDFEQALTRTNMHKMAYFQDDALVNFKLFAQNILKNQ